MNLQKPDSVKFSPRETEVLTHIARGYTYEETAIALGIGHETVATHLRNVYRKLSVHSKSEAVFEATRLGLIRF